MWSLIPDSFLVRCRAYGARVSFCYLSQPLRAGLTSAAPTALTQRKPIWEFIQRGMSNDPPAGSIVAVVTRREDRMPPSHFSLPS